MKNDHDKRLKALEETQNADRVTVIDFLGAATCEQVEHHGGASFNLTTGERTPIPAPPCPMKENCRCRH